MFYQYIKKETFHRKLYLFFCVPVVATNKPIWYTLLFTLLPFWDVHKINKKKFLLFLLVSVLMSPTMCNYYSFKEKRNKAITFAVVWWLLYMTILVTYLGGNTNNYLHVHRWIDSLQCGQSIRKNGCHQFSSSQSKLCVWNNHSQSLECFYCFLFSIQNLV